MDIAKPEAASKGRRYDGARSECIGGNDVWITTKANNHQHPLKTPLPDDEQSIKWDEKSGRQRTENPRPNEPPFMARVAASFVS